jgi:uncharacterized protein with von Willebrand factor type A (vWA) domain
MISGLSRFVAELRREKIAVSPAEWIDALRALEATGIEDRERFRAALRSTLVKSRRQQILFDQVFDRFFSAPARSRKGKKGRRAGGGGDAGRFRSDTGTTGRSAPRPSRDRRPDHRGDDPAKRARDRVAGPGGQVEWLRQAMDAVQSGGRRHGRMRRLLLEEGGEGRRGRGAEPIPADPRRRDLRAVLSEGDERKIAEAVPRLIERIRLRTGRRRRPSARGPLYLRRLFRENMASGGVPFVLPRRRLRPRRPRVLLLVDVSWSCARASALFLWMAGSFLALGKETRVILFVDRPVDATEQVERWLRRNRSRAERPASRPGRRQTRRLPGGSFAPAGQPFRELLESIPGLNLDASSDYGRVFHLLSRPPFRRAGRDTVLVVLGDGRTNRLDPLDWALDEAAERSAATLWLVPEPREQWGSGDSALADYLPHVDLAVEARDLDGLARGVAELLRKL